jgi:hypothetical protein
MLVALPAPAGRGRYVPEDDHRHARQRPGLHDRLHGDVTAARRVVEPQRTQLDRCSCPAALCAAPTASCARMAGRAITWMFQFALPAAGSR